MRRLKFSYGFEAVCLILLAAVLWAGVRYANQTGSASARSLDVQACDPGRADCVLELPDGGKLTLRFSPRPVPMLKAFSVEVRLQGVAAQSVKVDFSGVEMDMGYQRPILEAVGGGWYRGSASLPVCVTGSMTWKATVMLESATSRLSIPFHFSTHS